MPRVARYQLVLVAALLVRCATPHAPVGEDACPDLAVLDGESFAELSRRGPESGKVCLRYHRARTQVAWAVSPREPAPILTITRSALELREGDRLVGAWYGACSGEPALRGEVSPEATHYMVRYMTMRRPSALEVRVGPRVNAVDLMFALETIVDFHHRIYLDPRPAAEVLPCQRVAIPDASGDPAPLADALLGAVVGPRLPLVQSCFRRTVRPLPCSSLVRQVDVHIDGRGMVEDATVADHTLGTPDVDACVGAAIWDLVFPPPADGRRRQGTIRFQNCEVAPGSAPTLDLTPG